MRPKLSRTTIHTEHAPAAVGPYSQAIKTDGLIFVSGQLGLDPQSGQLRDGLEAQAEQILENLSAILDCAGCTMESIVKTTIFLVDMADFVKVNEIYGKVFSDTPPARSTVQVAALPLGGMVEIEAIALTI